MGFVRAARKRAYLKMGLTGPSGSGKTYSGLLLALGLAAPVGGYPGGRVAVIDTENGSASLYAHLGDYDVLELSAPFTVAKYGAAIAEAAASGYDVLLVDSISHEWAGDGGLLSVKESLDARGGNAFANWSRVTPQHEQFKSALLQAPLHVIVTMRSKHEYVMQEDGKGRCVPVKFGLAPVQREGFEYELSVVFDVAMTHEAVVRKDRTGLFEEFTGRLAPEHGRRLREWLLSAEEPGTDRAPAPAGDLAGAARAAKTAFAAGARCLGRDVCGEGGKYSNRKLSALLVDTLGRPVPEEPAAADWEEGLRRLSSSGRGPSSLADAAADPFTSAVPVGAG